MPNLMSVMCGLPNSGPVSCIACLSSVRVLVAVGWGVGFVCMVLLEPGPEKHEIREEASAFCFKIGNICSFIINVLLSSVSNQGLFVLAIV